MTASAIQPSWKLSDLARLRSWSLSDATAVPLWAAHILIGLLILYSLAFATHFTFRFEPIHYMDQYRYLANGFAHLHVYGYDTRDRPIPTGCIDCINYYGKVYYPYGPAPAIIQLFLVNFLKSRITDGAIVWGICAITLYAMFWITRWYAHEILRLKPAEAILAASAAVAAIGTTDIFLHTSTVPYAWSESCAAGQLLNLLSAFLLIRALHSGRYKEIFWSGVLGGLSFLCKQNYLPGVLAGCALLLWTARRQRWSREQKIKRVSALIVPVAVCAGVLLFYNYARFGSPLETGFPYLNASEAHPDRFQMPQPHRIPYNLYNHFLAGAQIRTSDFPFVLGKSSSFGRINTKDGSGGLLHNFPIFSVFISMPMLLLLIPAFFVVIVLLFERRTSPAWDYWLYLVALWCCVFAYFLNESGSFMRYEYDMPFLLGLCVLQVVVFSWRAVDRVKEPVSRKGIRYLFAAVLGLCFLEQAVLGADQTAGLILSRTDRFIHWPAAERKSDIRLRRRAHEIRSALFNIRPTIVVTSGSERVPTPSIEGSLWFIRDSGAVYRSNGTSWELVSGERLQFSVIFAADSASEIEPLVQFGSPPFTEALSVRYLGTDLVSLEYRYSNTQVCSSARYRVRPGAPIFLLIESDPVFQRIHVRLGRDTALDCATGVYQHDNTGPQLGINAVGLPGVGSRFSGVIRPVTNEVAENWEGERVRFKVALPKHPVKESEPLLQLGNVRGAADMLGIHYRSDGQINILFDHWSSPLCTSPPQLPNREREQLIEASIDPATGRVLVALNGRMAMGCNSGVFADSTKTRLQGKNTLGFTTVGPTFSGSIVELPDQR